MTGNPGNPSNVKPGNPVNPVIWAGSKRTNVSAYTPLMPPHFDRFVDPTVGGGTLVHALYGRLPQTWGSILISDLNPALVSFYQQLRDNPEELADAWEAHMRYHGASYYKLIRAVHPADLEPHERAAWFLYLNRNCFNGLWRERRDGHMNTPIGDTHPITRAQIVAASAALRYADIRCNDLLVTLGEARTGDFIFIDPPYAPISATSSFTSYTKDGWTNADDERLASRLHQLTDAGIPFMLASSEVPAIRERYADARHFIHEITTYRSISATNGGRGSVRELVITNYANEEAD